MWIMARPWNVFRSWNTNGLFNVKNWVKSVKSVKLAEIRRNRPNITLFWDLHNFRCVSSIFMIFGPLFDIYTFVGVTKMLKIAENSLRNRRFFDEFTAVLVSKKVIFGPKLSTIYWKNGSVLIKIGLKWRKWHHVYADRETFFSNDH